MGDPVFRWEYTYVDDNGFDDGRIPQAATLACRGVPFPAAILDVTRPVVNYRRSGPWWLVQDPAAGGVYAHNVLRLAVYHGLVPILSPSQLAAASDVEVTAVREVRVPVYDDDRHGHRLVQEVRERIRALTVETADGNGEELLRDLAAALLELREAMPGSRECSVRIGLASFPYRPWREGPLAMRLHPVILKDEHRTFPPTEDNAGRPASSRIGHDGDLQHPMERVLDRLNAQDASGIDALLDAPDLTAGRAYGLGSLLTARGDLGLAEAAWRRADDLGSADGAYELARLLRSCGDDAEAEARRADERGSPSGAYLLGLLRDQQGDDAGAETAWRRADERGNGPAAFRLGIAHMQRGETDEGEAAFRRADERGAARGATALGLRLKEIGNLKEAEAAWQRADERGDGLAAHLLGLQAMNRGDEIGAEAAWRRADERGEEASAMALGALYMSKGRLGTAKAAFRRADERGDAEGSFFLGALLGEEGNSAEAEQAYARAAQRGHAEAAFRLGCHLERRADKAGAAAAWQRAADLGSPGGALNLAYVLINKGDIRSAFTLLKTALSSRDPECAPRAALTLASLYKLAGAPAEARKLLQAVIASKHTEIAPMAVAELAALENDTADETGTPTPQTPE